MLKIVKAILKSDTHALQVWKTWYVKPIITNSSDTQPKNLDLQKWLLFEFVVTKYSSSTQLGEKKLSSIIPFYKDFVFLISEVLKFWISCLESTPKSKEKKSAKYIILGIFSKLQLYPGVTQLLKKSNRAQLNMPVSQLCFFLDTNSRFGFCNVGLRSS